MRMFAGPNGSGKTTVQRNLEQRFGPTFIGVLVNPDDLEATARRHGRLELAPFGVPAAEDDLRAAFTSSEFLKKHGLADAAAVLRCDGQVIDFSGLLMNSYYASVLADFLRSQLLAESVSFTFETVMSEPGKVSLLDRARSLGFRTYLYFVATDDPEINVSRVAVRVTKGGHDVPRDKILSRYERSLRLAAEAARRADRAFFFDTSGSEALFVGEGEDGQRPQARCEAVPDWFRVHVQDKF